jgi:hypothetical protein
MPRYTSRRRMAPIKYYVPYLDFPILEEILVRVPVEGGLERAKRR